MKALLVVSVAALVVVGGITLYANSVLSDIKEKDDQLTQTFEERAEDLRALDRLFDFKEAPALTLDPARFPTWLEVRKAVAQAIGTRVSEEAKSRFHARDTRNQVLRILRRELEEKKMSFLEYRVVTRQWQAIVAREEFGDLQQAWRAKVFNQQHPDGLPLPGPNRKADKKELDLVRRHARLLTDTMPADLMAPLLDEIAGR